MTICAQDRACAPLLGCAGNLLSALRHYHVREKWWLHVAVVMPDHLHFLAVFAGEKGVHEVVRPWKRWTARQLGVKWQKDFFDHRLRGDESRYEKSDYILRNPERAGLVRQWQEWPHRWSADPQA